MATPRVVDRPAVVPTSAEFCFGMNSGYGVGRRRCSLKALADRLIRAGEQAPGATALVTERAPTALPTSLLRWTKGSRLGGRAPGIAGHAPSSSIPQARHQLRGAPALLAEQKNRR